MSAAPELLQVEVGLLQNLVTIVGCPSTGRCLVCDPAFEVDRLYRLIADRGFTVAGVLLTHTHPDHVDGLPEVVARSGAVPVYVGAEEEAAARAAGAQARLVPLLGGEEIACGEVRIAVLATPGHTPAGRSYYLPAAPAVLTGDTLFAGSCGRTTFPGSDARTLFHSLQRLLALPEETRVYPGHDYGPTRTTTLAWESLHNPCLRCPDEAAFLRLQRQR